MNEVYKTISYLVVSLVICLISNILDSSFLNDFSGNFIALLTTLLAINIASGSLIAGKIKEIQDKSGHPFHNTKKELKRGLMVQIVLIFGSFFLLLFKNSSVLKERFGEGLINTIGNALTITIFIYYIDTIYDLGKALFSIMEFREPPTE